MHYYIMQSDMTANFDSTLVQTWINLANKKKYWFSFKFIQSACLGYGAKLAEPMTRQEIAFLGQQVNKISKDVRNYQLW